ncbi:MAG: class I SAM-dependent methyltransferase [Myxococcales bacterium]|nr:class I SAM-dependent methyltransferase [Myxococcales bacterium]
MSAGAPSVAPLRPTQRALLELGQRLRAAGYAFTTITPASHARVNARAEGANARSLRDVFGWNRPFAPEVLPAPIFEAAVRAEALTEEAGLHRSRVRFSTLGADLFVHSGFPTTEPDAVFFGPDTYRYARYLRQHARTARRVVDVGCGSGAGAIVLRDRCEQLTLADINPRAIDFAAVNAALNEAGSVEVVQSDVLRGVPGAVDLVVSNPPFLVDELERAYRHGGGALGAGLSVRIVAGSIARLSPGGRLVLYTASAIVDGEDTFGAAIAPLLDRDDVRATYEEIDPDVFGEELDRAVYRRVDRLAVVGLVVDRVV